MANVGDFGCRCCCYTFCSFSTIAHKALIGCWFKLCICIKMHKTVNNMNNGRKKIHSRYEMNFREFSGFFDRTAYYFVYALINTVNGFLSYSSSVRTVCNSKVQHNMCVEACFHTGDLKLSKNLVRSVHMLKLILHWTLMFVCVCAQLDIYNVLCRDAILNVRICFIQEDN